MLSLSFLTLIKLLKLTGVIIFSHGVLSVAFSQDRRLELLTASIVVPVGFLICWSTGFLFMKTMGLTFLAPWIYLTMLMSTVSMAATLFSVVYGRYKREFSWVSFSAFFGSVMLMVTKQEVLLGVLLPMFALLYLLSPRGERSVANLDGDTVGKEHLLLLLNVLGFLMRCEGASLVFLLVVVMPLKYGLDIQLDGGTGLVAWVHGVLLIIYLTVLLSTGRFMQMNKRTILLFSGASLLPFANFFLSKKLATVSPV